MVCLLELVSDVSVDNSFIVSFALKSLLTPVFGGSSGKDCCMPGLVACARDPTDLWR
jgi:hypothetical protein